MRCFYLQDTRDAPAASNQASCRGANTFRCLITQIQIWNCWSSGCAQMLFESAADWSERGPEPRTSHDPVRKRPIRLLRPTNIHAHTAALEIQRSLRQAPSSSDWDRSLADRSGGSCSFCSSRLEIRSTGSKGRSLTTSCSTSGRA